MGKIHITNVARKDGTSGIGADPPNFAGLNYIVYFTNDGALGGTVSGSFDMTTETWTFVTPTSQSVTTPADAPPNP